MKSSAKTIQKRTPVKKGTRGALSKMARSTKKYGKRTLRDILLSKTFNSGFKVLVGMMIAGSALYGAYAFIGTSIAGDVVVSQSEILSRVGKHTQLPTGEPDAVVRVQDPDTLKKQNSLFENVKEGDYIIMYSSLAVVYDLRNDTIVALKRTDR